MQLPHLILILVLPLLPFFAPPPTFPLSPCPFTLTDFPPQRGCLSGSVSTPPPSFGLYPPEEEGNRGCGHFSLPCLSSLPLFPVFIPLFLFHCRSSYLTLPILPYPLPSFHSSLPLSPTLLLSSVSPLLFPFSLSLLSSPSPLSIPLFVPKRQCCCFDGENRKIYGSDIQGEKLKNINVFIYKKPKKKYNLKRQLLSCLQFYSKHLCVLSV